MQTARTHFVSHLGKGPLYNDKAAVFGRQLFASPDGFRIFVKGNQPALWPQAGEQCSTMTSSAEGAVDIDAVRLNGERIKRLVQQYTDMGIGGHGTHRLSECSSAGNSPASCDSSR